MASSPARPQLSWLGLAMVVASLVIVIHSIAHGGVPWVGTVVAAFVLCDGALRLVLGFAVEPAPSEWRGALAAGLFLARYVLEGVALAVVLGGRDRPLSAA